MDVLAQMGFGLAVAAFALTVLATRRVLVYLRQRQIMDLPNERSSHTLPTPRGGGLATTPVMVLALLALPDFRLLAVGAVLLLAISWVDDRRGLLPLPRFATQILAVAVFLMLLPAESLVFQGALPAWADHLLVGLGWLWFVNLYNFMDGIDGITGIETVSLGVGIAVIGGTALAAPALAIAAVAAAFLLFNWHPAKLFLGDSGSVPFGYVLGGLLVLLAVGGHLAAALILPAYYLADATITILRRALAGEKIWQPHRKHFYQRAVQGGKRHDQVVLVIAAGNVMLMACAMAAARGQTLWAGAAAVVVVAGVLLVLQMWSRGGRA
ncbi:MraY family glycosyltransferase [Magnetospirillum gryphiswaldense]|uniref:Glycosyl transferase, family 4 n=1 Tax=Magnetospirillum gryphiswaldense TaxID=55518 RepID=A4U2X1_9PROT|nr:glycosyltransferase family 4 protein [Magnetospirillum gryphiswaldense]AVM75637.1 putative undecaprenyl-phosphate N-acetylglucosaminyl 1-phosphate transferase [Magnetospirillum gryphiswaldense MSR-1]AVM79540.1 putative undecaprenyl-phosphate N-acetylglucosaminyl 1-phosphate transferase [Magnetospirillum gryphiswaldense]CAM77228.1 Glycosyl transferase, family 4 [Magnetospirillum gryphiswaldense MSR-1]